MAAVADDRDWTLGESIKTDQGTVRYAVFGSGAPAVLIHGTPFSSYVWRRLVPLLARDRRLYVYDLPGYGRSEMRAGQDVSLAAQGRVLAQVLRAWDLDAPAIVAHDFGGATVLRAHLLEGVALSSLVLVDAVALRPWGSPMVQHARDHEAALAGLPAYLHEALVRAYIPTAAAQALPEATLDALARPWLGPLGQAAFYRQIAQMDQAYTAEFENRLGEIGVPVQVVWGAQDAWLPVEHGHRLASLIPGARLDIVPGAGHLIQEDRPEALLAAILRFWAALD